MELRRKNPYSELEKALGYRFKKRSLLVAGLTHPSYRFENPHVADDNQRLEFLGDAVLGFLTAAHLYHAMGDKNEGVLTAVRSLVTSGKALAGLAKSIDLGSYLLVGKGEEASGGRRRQSGLADAFEAVLGAVYLDAGLKGVKKVFKKLFVRLIEEAGDDMWRGNPKGKLQEMVQARWKSNPVYNLTGQNGPPHAAIFSVEVLVGGKIVGSGTGSTKQSAECRAASAALDHFGSFEG